MTRKLFNRCFGLFLDPLLGRRSFRLLHVDGRLFREKVFKSRHIQSNAFVAFCAWQHFDGHCSRIDDLAICVFSDPNPRVLDGARDVGSQAVCFQAWICSFCFALSEALLELGLRLCPFAVLKDLTASCKGSSLNFFLF